MFGCTAESITSQRNLNVCVLVDILYAFLQTPEEALDDSHDARGHSVLRSTRLLLEVHKCEPDKLYDCNDKGSKSQRAEVVAEAIPHTCSNGLPFTFVFS